VLLVSMRLPVGSVKSLGLCLDLLTTVNRIFLRGHKDTPLLYDCVADGRVRYVRDPPGAEDWLPIPLILTRGWADCKSLACWRCAELLEAGENARPAVSYRMTYDYTGRPLELWHIQVRRGYNAGPYAGLIEDPSAASGMLGDGQ